MSDVAGFREGNEHGLLLYDFGASPCARRCRITMLEKGLVWDTEVIDLSRLEQRNPAYLAINPNGFVPALAHGERVIYESNVITEYLDDVFPETPLYPADAWELAQVRMWQSAELAMAKDYRMLMYQRVLGPVLRLTRTLEGALAAVRRSTDAEADLAWEERVWRLAVLTPEEEADCEDRLLQWLDKLEAALEGREFLVGGRFTQAEVSVYPRVAMFPFAGMGIGRARYPALARWMEGLARRESFARTLTEQDRGLGLLARVGVLPWLGRTMVKGERERSLLEKLGLRVLKKVFEKVLGKDEGAPVAAGAREVRRPREGAVAPGDARRRCGEASLPDEPIVLYDCPYSPHARRIRILLAAKGLEWETIPIDMTRMEHKASAYLAVNPNGELPALRHGERVIYDSQVIAEYLDSTYSGDGLPGFYPDDALLAAEVRMWLALEAGTHKEFRPLFYLHVVRPELVGAGTSVADIEALVSEGVHPSHAAWLRDTLEGSPRFDTSEALAREIIEGKLDVVEGGLAGRPYLVGESLTMADLAWFTRIDMLGGLGVEVDAARYPEINRWLGELRGSVACDS